MWHDGDVAGDESIWLQQSSNSSEEDRRDASDKVDCVNLERDSENMTGRRALQILNETNGIVLAFYAGRRVSRKMAKMKPPK